MIERHWPADQAKTLHHRRNRKASRIRECTTPQHHLCRGCIRKVTRGRDDATAPMCHRRSQHRQANKTMTLHRRRNRKAPRIRDCTTPRHHLCHGAHSKGHAGPRRRHGACVTGVVEGHRLADQTTALRRRRNQKAPHSRESTTPRHHLCRGYIRKARRDRDDVTAPVCHRQRCRASPSRDTPKSTRVRTPPKKRDKEPPPTPKAAAPPPSSGTLHRQPHEPLVTTHRSPR